MDTAERHTVFPKAGVARKGGNPSRYLQRGNCRSSKQRVRPRSTKTACCGCLDHHRARSIDPVLELADLGRPVDEGLGCGDVSYLIGPILARLVYQGLASTNPLFRG